jgi:hypothetical protein
MAGNIFEDRPSKWRRAVKCCKGTVWVPFKMIRQKIPGLSSWTLDELGARMKCDKCGKRPERYYPARQSDAPGFARNY